MARQTVILALVGLLLLAQGCDRPWTFYSDDGQRLPPPSGVALKPQDGSPVPDVPLPDGFVAISDKCRFAWVGGVRFVDHFYQGRARLDRIIDFYHEQLIRHGWDKLADDQNNGGTIVMQYYKGRENLELHVTRTDRVATIRLLIQARGGPLGPRPIAP